MLYPVQAMMTGQHGEVTGVLGSEVRQDGFRLTPGDQDFWTYSLNTTNLLVGTELQPGDQDFWTHSLNTTNLWVGTELQPRRNKQE
jgi:hypothetical protein